MKKIIFGIILVSIAVIAGAPYANGLIMEKLAKKASADLNQLYGDTGSDVAIEIIDYERAYASTRVKWKIDLGNLQGVYGLKEIIIVDEATHGYAGVVSKSSLTENKWFADFVNQTLDGNNPLDITTRFNLLGKMESTIVLDAFTLNAGEDNVEVKAGKLVLACSKGFQTISSKGSWEGMAIPDKLKMESISFDADLEKLTNYVWTGDGSVKIKHCAALPNDEPLEMSNLVCGYSMRYKKSDNALSMGIDYGMDHLSFEGNRIDDAFVHIGINNMDADGYENFMTLYTQIINKAMRGMTNPQKGTDQMEAIMQQQMAANAIPFVGALEKMLKGGFEIKVSDLKITLPQGEVKGAAALRLNKDMSMAQFLPLIAQPQLALDIFSLHSDVRLPASLVGDNPAFLSPAYPGMQTGLFEKQGQEVVHKAETRDGKLYLNGQEVILN